MNARTTLAENGGGIRSITPDALVFAALEAIAEHKVGALMVLEGALNLALTQKDLIIQQLEQYIAPGP